MPATSNRKWLNRTSLDVLQDIEFFDTIRLRISDRFSLYEASDIQFGALGTYRNDFREGFLSYLGNGGLFFEAGRINLKNGVAAASSPTDFFRTRTTLSLTSADPTVARKNRMGTVMGRAQWIWGGGALSFNYAPKLQEASILTSRPPQTFDPLFGQTNSEERMLATLNFDFADMGPQLLYYREGTGTSRFGLSLSRILHQKSVAYLEWSGAVEGNLSARASSFGLATGSLSPGTQVTPQADAGSTFQNDLSLGVNWVSGREGVVLVFNVEYSYHQSGFTKADFDNWILLGSTNSSLVTPLWFVRSFATDRQEQLSQHQVFLRAEWDDAFFKSSYLNLSAFAYVNPLDWSMMTQLSLLYNASKYWNFGAYLGTLWGGPDTVYGSTTQKANFNLQVVRYF